MISTPRMTRFALTLVLGASFAACSGDDTSSPGSGDGTTTPMPPAANSVNVDDFLFNPTSLDVSTGTTVTWTWVGAASHSVTFNDGIGNSVTQASGTHTREFAAAGTFGYFCVVHGAGVMSGTVVVQ